MADRQAKQAARRMRLGTKSCAECRRRKVKCIFPPESSICQGCALHNVACTAQQPRCQAQDEPETDKTALQQRVNELEGLVKSLAESVRVATANNSADASVTSSTTEGGSSSATLLTTSHPADSPFINLFRDAMLISNSDGYLQDTDGKLKNSAETPSPCGGLPSHLRPHIPDQDTIRAIIRATQKYWCTWPPCYYGTEPHESFQVNRDGEGEDVLLKLISQQRLDASFCKALLWLALCIQQLPVDCFRRYLPNTSSRQDVLSPYLAFCGIVLAGEEEANLDAVQCHILRFKLYINMGMPQKAWSCTRSAVSTATLLGLNRLDSTAKESHRMIWLLSWETERQLSLVLGYPSAVQTTTTTPFGSLPMGLEGPTAYRILYSLALVYGDVINRDQNPTSVSYAATVKIDQDVGELRKLFPVEWWDPGNVGDSLGDFYYQEITKFLFFLLVKLVHLPYMLKSVHDKRYEYSRHAALDAAREQIRSYVRMRNFPGAEILMCELMDFQAFNAGMTLIIGTLYMPNSDPTPLDILSEDGSLIESLIASLRQTALLLECRVSEQGARVLELLTVTRRFAEGSKLEVLVPYFGKLTINMPILNHEASIAASSTGSAPSPSIGQPYGLSNPCTPPPVEFSTNEFISGASMPFKQGDELQQEWCSVFDPNACYDWQQTWTRMQID
ncbi:N-terminal binuclear Zn cluster-containing/DNA binding domain-containing protein [Pochonia chlamydosporia 170]|uniref:N-terminal binuclear Zn cluster-containing/DNA binding domain-containing protein n=1 Tax=Pochonia chlamydosporia 170 TaxID=1380566 RepID=A0A179FJP2_METCM|nr:N-terminal binuclear Zn cluster-containing/DNA binding domain-containing protein [Pochonia chlamydosporia 170]OAQ65481.1 N-terminal binuclear Zn cluster-containing/DNA binding domain-containing protein [Pochonia chlamydosporia 170]